MEYEPNYLASCAYEIVKVIDRPGPITSEYYYGLKRALQSILGQETWGAGVAEVATWELQVDDMIALFKYIERAGIFHAKAKGDVVTFNGKRFVYNPDDSVKTMMLRMKELLLLLQKGEPVSTWSMLVKLL